MRNTVYEADGYEETTVDQIPLRPDPTASAFGDRRQNHLLYVDKTARIVAFLRAQWWGQFQALRS